MEQASKDRIFDILAANDISKVVMEFSGGHDEGGADGWSFCSTDKTAEIEFLPPEPVVAVYKNILADMEEIVLEYFKFFTNQPASWGEVEWDVTQRKVFLFAEQEVFHTKKIHEAL